jgi:Ca2+-binding RTX toxin-like protein
LAIKAKFNNQEKNKMNIIPNKENIISGTNANNRLYGQDGDDTLDGETRTQEKVA